MNGYITVFEISKAADEGAKHLLTIILKAAGLLWLLAVLRWRRRKPVEYIMPIVLMAAGFAGLFISLNKHRMAESLYEIYQNHQYDIVEGTVKVSFEQPANGHTQGDIIIINDKVFEINYFLVTPCYHTTIAYGGVLKDGVRARVYHYNDNILRVDIKDIDGTFNSKESAEMVHPSAPTKSLQWTPFDYFWAGCLVIANILFYYRKIILYYKGCRVSPRSFFSDGSEMKRLIAEESSIAMRKTYILINKAILVLFLTGLLCCIFRVIFTS